jgi:recombination protein RecT
MTNQIMTVPDIVRGVEPECLQLVQSHNSVNWGAEMNYAIQLLCANSFAVSIAQQNPVSVQNALRNASAIGISLNPANKHAYLVPRKSQSSMGICLDISYMGLMHLAQSTGSIEWGQAKLVYEVDAYTNNGIDKAPEHKYPAFGKRGNLVGAYCTVKTSTGAYLTEEMSVDQIHDVRARSEAYTGGKNGKPPSGPWVTDYEEMCRKTVVKRAAKYWPKVERLNEAVNYLNTDGGEGISKDEPVRDISPISMESEAWLTDYRNSLDEPKQSQFDTWLKQPVSQLTEESAQKAITALKAKSNGGAK